MLLKCVCFQIWLLSILTRDPVVAALTKMVSLLFLHQEPTPGPSVGSPTPTQVTPLLRQAFLLDTRTPATVSTVAVQAASRVKVCERDRESAIKDALMDKRENPSLRTIP